MINQQTTRVRIIKVWISIPTVTWDMDKYYYFIWNISLFLKIGSHVSNWKSALSLVSKVVLTSAQTFDPRRWKSNLILGIGGFPNYSYNRIYIFITFPSSCSYNNVSRSRLMMMDDEGFS